MGKKKTAMKRGGMAKKKTAKMRGGGMAKKKTAKMRGGGMASGSREGSIINTPTAFKKGGRVKKTGPSRPLAVAKKTIEKLKKQIENMKPGVDKFKARRDFLGKGLGAAGIGALKPRKSRPDMSDIAGRKERPQSNPSEYNRSPGRIRPPQRPGQQGQPGRIRPPQKPGREPRRMPRMIPGSNAIEMKKGLPSGTVIGKDGRPVPSLRASKGGRVK